MQTRIPHKNHKPETNKIQVAHPSKNQNRKRGITTITNKFGDELMFCPSCGAVLENFTVEEGGWCPKCQEWYSGDIVMERMEEEYGEIFR
jgi:hypothetical protein